MASTKLRFENEIKEYDEDVPHSLPRRIVNGLGM